MVENGFCNSLSLGNKVLNSRANQIKFVSKSKRAEIELNLNINFNAIFFYGFT